MTTSIGCFNFNRKDFGLVWNAALETGGVAVGEEIAITLEIEMIKKGEISETIDKSPRHTAER